MNFIIKQILISALMIFSISCGNAQTIEYKLSADQFEQKMEELKNEHLVDVRTQGEFKEGHLEGAMNIDYYSEDFLKQIQLLDKSRPVMVYCRSGSRSAKAAEIMRKNGFKQVYEMKDGILDWDAKKKDLVN